MSHLQAFIHVGWLALGFLNHQQYQPIPGDSFQALPPLIGQKSQGQPPLGWMYKTLRKQCGLVPLTTNLNWVTVDGFPKHVTLYHLYKMLSCVVGKRWIYLWWPETRLPLLWLPACRYIVRLNVRTSWRVWTLGWLMMNPYTSLVPIIISRPGKTYIPPKSIFFWCIGVPEICSGCMLFNLAIFESRFFFIPLQVDPFLFLFPVLHRTTGATKLNSALS